jgi:hypothetical protein
MRYRCVLKAVLFLAVAGLCMACGPVSTYQVVTESTYPGAARRPIQNRLFLMDARKLPDTTLIDAVNQGEWEQFEAKIGRVADDTTRVLLQSIRLLKEKKYPEAYQLLQAVRDEGNDFQALMLKTDCRYALNTPSVDIRAYYQHVFDRTSNSTVKEIVKTRFRFVTYER